MKSSSWRQGLVRDSVQPGWLARVYAGLTAATSLLVPVGAYGVAHNDWKLPLAFAGVGAVAMVLASLCWTRAARELNRRGLWPSALGLIDLVRLRLLILDLPYSTVFLRYRTHFISPNDVAQALMRIASAGAKREGVFLDRALDTTRQPHLLAGDLAIRLVEISDEEPDAGRNVRQDLLAVAAETEWLDYDVAFAILHAGFREPS